MLEQLLMMTCFQRINSEPGIALSLSCSHLQAPYSKDSVVAEVETYSEDLGQVQD